MGGEVGRVPGGVDDGGSGDMCRLRVAKVTRNNLCNAAHDVQRVADNAVSMLMCGEKVGKRCIRSCERWRNVAGVVRAGVAVLQCVVWA